MPIPSRPKIYHIVHVDRLSSIVKSDGLLCDAMVVDQGITGTKIGMDNIKRRRLTELTLQTNPTLHVGDCVPFYFCPRSVMLYLIHKGNYCDLPFQGGQSFIIHLEADLYDSIHWANRERLHWAFTSSNAGSRYFLDYSDQAQLSFIDWESVHTNLWSGPGIPLQVKENKQAEFLVERWFSWKLVERIGVYSDTACNKVAQVLPEAEYRPKLEKIPAWYY